MSPLFTISSSESILYNFGTGTPYFIQVDLKKLLSVHERELKEYLGGSLNNVQVTKVCQFLGHVARMKVVNDSKLQLSDLAFAFETYYNVDTVKRKLSAKDLTCQEKEFFDFFKGVLKGVKTQIEAKRKLE